MVVVCLSVGMVLGILADHAIVKAQSQPVEPSAAAWEIQTGSWTGGNAGGYYIVKLNRITGETLILDRQDNKSSIPRKRPLAQAVGGTKARQEALGGRIARCSRVAGSQFRFASFLVLLRHRFCW